MINILSNTDNSKSTSRNLRISEIFYSLQGEGANIGIPAVFLRTALCNLQCSWCDTKYTWDWANYDYSKEVKMMTISEILDILHSFNTRHLVLTGGEPLIQQEQLLLLLEMLKDQGYRIEVETNGTILPLPDIEKSIDQWNVSPKLNNANNIQNTEVSECYEFFAANRKTFFKFVVQRSSDVVEIDNLATKYEIPKEQIILMPECRNHEEMTLQSDWISRICLDKGYRFSTRLHVLLWSGKRGS